jgi:hypothetical protein
MVVNQSLVKGKNKMTLASFSLFAVDRWSLFEGGLQQKLEIRAIFET